MIAADLIERLRGLAHDEELSSSARGLISGALPPIERGDTDNARVWRLLRAAEDMRRGRGGLSALAAAVRMLARGEVEIDVVRKAGAR